MTNAYDLIAEARAKFGELTAAEEKMLRCAESGDLAYCGPSEKDDDPANDPATADQWGKDRTIRARLIRWLCVDHEAREQVDPRGIQVHAARIGDSPDEINLDLDAIDIPFRIFFQRCNFEVPLQLRDANVLALNLASSRMPAFLADRIVAETVSLRGLDARGEVRLADADLGGQLVLSGAQFGDASLDLTHASIGPIVDDEASWPKKGNLLLDGFIYERIGEGPTTADDRLKWLARQPDGFIPQPYRQLAKVLRDRGDDAGARKVLIAMEDARAEHGGLGRGQRLASRILRATVGYGYTPLRALRYIVALVLLGTFLFWWGHVTRVITPFETRDTVTQVRPFNPFIYSLETFLPLVDLRMARHWMPDPNVAPIALLGPFSDTPMQAPWWLGRVLRWYLWVHILLGWFFSAMFIAGITGLVRRDRD